MALGLVFKVGGSVRIPSSTSEDLCELTLESIGV